MKSIELFSGAGGLALGIANSGFNHAALVEFDKHACGTIRENQRRGVKPILHWPLYETDVRNFDYKGFQDRIDLLAGGPPCQPFSIAGKHRGRKDNRNMFPEYFRAVRELRPKVILVENVRGLLRKSFSKYFEYILLQLTYPEIILKPGENWVNHLSRLECYHTSGHNDSLSYRVVFRLLNAADYGVPQLRERVFIVGFRSDLDIAWSFPNPTHSLDSLLLSKWVTGEYWEKHKVSKRSRPPIPARLKRRVSRLQPMLFHNKPWLTVRDAIWDLPDPSEKDYSGTIPNHKHNPGARSYPGHTGSPLDDPAKTLKAGDHGVPGGENMLVYPDGRLRYFSVRESARLQTFPDSFIFCGSWSEIMRQLGNAVPVRLAEIIAGEIYKIVCPKEFRTGGGVPYSLGNFIRQITGHLNVSSLFEQFIPNRPKLAVSNLCVPVSIFLAWVSKFIETDLPNSN